MGMLQGKVQDDTFVVVDTYALPVEGTETRVNAAEGAYEYMISYLQTCKARPPLCPAAAACASCCLACVHVCGCTHCGGVLQRRWLSF